MAEPKRKRNRNRKGLRRLYECACGWGTNVNRLGPGVPPPTVCCRQCGEPVEPTPRRPCAGCGRMTSGRHCSICTQQKGLGTLLDLALLAEKGDRRKGRQRWRALAAQQRRIQTMLFGRVSG